MNIFICSSDCKNCPEKKTCPFRSEINQKYLEKFSDAPTEFKEILEEKIDNMNPEDFLQITNTSLFNLIESLYYQSNEDTKISIRDVSMKISKIIEKKHPNIFDKDSVFKEKIESFILVIAQRIIEAIEGTCNKECSKCFISKDCRKIFKN
jgi:hypothetical protein